MNYLIVLAALTLAACGGGGNEGISSGNAPYSERTVAPLQTDPAISTDPEHHVAINPQPAATARGKLFVFLPATGGTPVRYLSILRLGAARGYHSIGLNYPNAVSVGELCVFSDDADCHGKVRHEVITGEDSSALGSVLPANSIVNRLQKLLHYLHQQFPNEGWGQYLDGGQIVWSKITLAGHSQGGGHAGMMSKLFAMDRTVYFSSPIDWRVPGNEPASWTALPNLTSAVRQFGFLHLQDAANLIGGDWAAMGLDAFGGMTLVEDVGSNFGSSHQFATNLSLASGTPHNSTVLDSDTPRAGNGAPLFEGLWQHLCFP